MDKVKDDQNSLIVTLEKQQRKMEEGALLVELYAEDVEKCMLVINSAMAAGMSWTDIDLMVKAETAKGTLPCWHILILLVYSYLTGVFSYRCRMLTLLLCCCHIVIVLLYRYFNPNPKPEPLP